MRRQGPPKPLKRAGTWYLVRHVPKEYASLDPRRPVRISTGIAIVDDPKGIRAKVAVGQIAAELDAYWRGLVDGKSAEARERFDAAQRRARQLGYQYQTNAELSAGFAAELFDRLKDLADRGKIEDEAEVAAVLGGESRPDLRISDLVPEFEAISRGTLGLMSADQVRKWRNPKKRAADNLIEVVTDKRLADLTRSDAIQFRKWWQARIETEELDIATANKDFGHVAKMFDSVNMAHDMGLKPVFSRMRIEGAVVKQRAAFDADYVQSDILKAGVLDDLNEDARDILRLVADTGLRLSEACNLTEETIFLDAPVPFVRVQADGRKMKTAHSARDIPLVGVALDAMQRHPKGFPRYRDRAAALSALVNKVLRHRKLLPTSKHSLYSLRHTFEDRLTAVEAPDKLIAALMGHKFFRPKYGAGPSLEQKREWMAKIAYLTPAGSPPAPAVPE